MECPKCKSKRFVKNGIIFQRNPPMPIHAKGIPFPKGCLWHGKGILQRSPSARSPLDWDPRKNKLIQSKAETHIIESQNGRVRHYLARFKRKTLCYSKSIAMVHLTLLLFFVPLLYLSFKENLIIFSRLDLVFSVSLHGKDCKYWHKKAIFRILKYKTKNFI